MVGGGVSVLRCASHHERSAPSLASKSRSGASSPDRCAQPVPAARGDQDDAPLAEYLLDDDGLHRVPRDAAGEKPAYDSLVLVEVDPDPGKPPGQPAQHNELDSYHGHENRVEPC